MSNVVNTGMLTGGNIDVIIDLIFNADDDTNPAKELNFLEEQLEDAKATYDCLELEKIEANRESGFFKFMPSARTMRSDEAINRDIFICNTIIEKLEKMISIRVEIIKE